MCVRGTPASGRALSGVPHGADVPVGHTPDDDVPKAGSYVSGTHSGPPGGPAGPAADLAAREDDEGSELVGHALGVTLHVGRRLAGLGIGAEVLHRQVEVAEAVLQPRQ